jgi:histidine triad (HIT) family protein
MKKDDCIFCKIANGEIPSASPYENDDFKVIFDVAPANRGHALILPKEHFDNAFEIEPELAGKIFAFGTRLARAIREETGCEGMNLLQNNGEVAGQTVNHFHLHLVPRFKGDDVTMTWKQGEADPDDSAKLAKAIAEKLQ